MTYGMISVRGRKTFTANSTLMKYIRAAILDSGVNLYRHKKLAFSPDQDIDPVEANFLDCFCSNSGSLVTAEEADGLAEKITAALPMWIANAKVVVPKEVVFLEMPGEKEGDPNRCLGMSAYDVWAPPRRATEIGARDKVAGLIQKFAKSCGDASTRRRICVW